MFGKRQKNAVFLGEEIGSKLSNPAQIMVDKLYTFEYNAQLGGRKKETEEQREELVDQIRKSIEFPQGYSIKTFEVALSHCDFSHTYNKQTLYDALERGLKYNMPDEMERKALALKIIESVDDSKQIDSFFVADQFSRITSFPDGYSKLSCLQEAHNGALYELAQVQTEKEGDAIVRRTAYTNASSILSTFINKELAIQEFVQASEDNQTM